MRTLQWATSTSPLQTTMRFLFSVPLLALCLLLFVSGCVEDIDGIQVRQDSDEAPWVVTSGQPYETEMDDRGAYVAVHTGLLTSSGQRSTRLDRVIDAEVYAGPSDPVGDPHWITRAIVEDESGQKLWTQRVNSLYQLLEMLGSVVEQLSPIDVGVDQIHTLARQRYPELLQFAVKVPVNLEGAHTYRLEIHEPDDGWQPLTEHTIDELHDAAAPPEVDVDYEIDTLVSNGPVDDRLNVAILGDGYRSDERHRFESDAQKVASRLLESTPFSEHEDLFNIRTVWTPSEESGAGFDCNHPNADPDCVPDFRDTFYETVFVIPALAAEFGDTLGLDLGDVSDRVALPLRLERIYEMAALAHYDEIIFISNSAKRSGFAGAYVALITNFEQGSSNADFADVAVHEVGHTLGLLGDEYNLDGDACYFNEPTVPLPVNISQLQDDTVHWQEWVEEDTPLPTSSVDPAYSDAVGAFQGAYNCDDLVRPVDRCKMRSSHEDFCPVCNEQLVRRIYSAVDPAPREPATVQFDPSSQQATFSVPLRQEGGQRYAIDWTVDGALRDQTSQGHFDLSASSLSDDRWTEVKAHVRNETDFLRTPDEATATTYRFEVRRDL